MNWIFLYLSPNLGQQKEGDSVFYPLPSPASWFLGVGILVLSAHVIRVIFSLIVTQVGW